MALYTIDVTEVRHVPCTYKVEAKSPEEAIRKARRGDTVQETEDGMGEVNDRFVCVQADKLKGEGDDEPDEVSVGDLIRLTQAIDLHGEDGKDHTLNIGKAMEVVQVDDGIIWLETNVAPAGEPENVVRFNVTLDDGVAYTTTDEEEEDGK